MKFQCNPEEALIADHLQWASEILIQDNLAKFRGAPKEAYPCCVGCGGFTLHPTAAKLGPGFWRTFRAKGADEVKGAGSGTAYDLACYQAAQKRHEGDEVAKVLVEFDEEGELVCHVEKGDGEKQDMRDKAKGALTRNGPEQPPCGCLLPPPKEDW